MGREEGVAAPGRVTNEQAVHAAEYSARLQPLGMGYLKISLLRNLVAMD